MTTTLALLASVLCAQVPIEQQPDVPALVTALKEARAKRPLDAAALVAIKGGRVEPTLAQDLARFDWLTAGAYSLTQKTFGPTYLDDVPLQYDFTRYLPDGQQLFYSLNPQPKDPTKHLVTHVNFAVPSYTSWAIRKVGKQTYVEITAHGEKELHRVVSYERGVLIRDISYDGKVNSKRLMFRDVMVAMPRIIESTGK